MDKPDDKLEDVLNQEKQATAKKIAIVDTGGSITYSLFLGCLLDCSAGLNCTGIVASRTYATAVNTVTGGFYGWWREKAFSVTKTTKESGKIKKTIVDLLAFNTVQVPIYATAIAVGGLISEGKIDWEKVQDGSTYLATISPLVGPTMGWYMDRFRKLFGIKSATEKAYKNKLN